MEGGVSGSDERLQRDEVWKMSKGPEVQRHPTGWYTCRSRLVRGCSDGTSLADHVQIRRRLATGSSGLLRDQS